MVPVSAPLGWMQTPKQHTRARSRQATPRRELSDCHAMNTIWFLLPRPMAAMVWHTGRATRPRRPTRPDKCTVALVGNCPSLFVIGAANAWARRAGRACPPHLVRRGAGGGHYDEQAQGGRTACSHRSFLSVPCGWLATRRLRCVRVGVWQHTRARTRTTPDIHCPPCRPGGGRRSSSTLIAKLIYGTTLGHAEIAGRKGRQWPS